jgi:hypothetical protein
VTRHEVLSRVHGILNPRTYLEIGVREGASLSLSRVSSIAVDPMFTVTEEINCDVRLVRSTSDAFFAQPAPIAHFGGMPIELAFIDGMHLLEYALRDFINVERHAHWSSVVILDDMLPRNVDEAARERRTTYWAGDVYKMIPILHRYRPELLVLPLNTEPTGVLLILGVDPGNTTLTDKYKEIVAGYVVGDPQEVPKEILERRCAFDPEKALDAPFWSLLENGRTTERAFFLKKLYAEVEKILDLSATPRVGNWRPEAPPPATESDTPQTGSLRLGLTRGSFWLRITSGLAKRPGLRRWGGRIVAVLPTRWRRAISALVCRARANSKPI